MRKVNRIGLRYEKLTVIEEVRIEGKKGIYYKCLCDCGNYTTVNSSDLGRTKSCGCANYVYNYGDYELEYIKNNYSTMTSEEISKELGLPKHIVVQIANLKLEVNKYKRVNWTDEIIDYMKENYDKLGAKKIAEKFNIPNTAVEKKASVLGLKFIPKRLHVGTQGYLIRILENGTRILEHRYVMSNHLNRELISDEIVHHIDGDKLNNDIENLQVVTREEHCKIHHHESDL